MSVDKNQRMLSVNQVADLLNVSTRTVRRMIEDDELHHHRVGRGEKNAIRISPEDLRAYINSTRR